MGEVIQFRRDPWLTKRELARQLGCSVRYLEYRLSEGMPSRLFAGRRQMRQSAVESWLTANGHLRRDQDDRPT